VTAADAGVYTVVVSGSCGSPVTNSALLVVNSNAVIATPISNSTNCPGTTAFFAVGATGTDLSYQWYKDNGVLNGETSSMLTVSNVTSASAGVYSVVVTGTCGSNVTSSALLVVNTNTLITVPPVNLTNCPGTTASFSLSAIGTGLSYQWFKGTNFLADTNILT